MILFFEKKSIKHALLLVAFVLAAYSNIYSNQFALDDVDYIIDWPLIQDWKNFPNFFINYTPPVGQEGIYSPLKTVFHAINYHLFGLNPLGYHFVSMLIHLMGIFLVYKIAYRLSQEFSVAYLTALIFALHPVHSESIVFLTASVDMMGVLFMFGSLLFYIKAYQEQFSVQNYGISFLLAVMAVFTHELCISLPIVLFWYEFCFVKEKGYSYKKTIQNVLPFLLIVLIYALCKFLVLGGVTRGGYVYGSFYYTFLITIKAFAQYIGIMFFPIVLTHNHVISEGIFSFDQLDFNRAAVVSQSIFQWQVFLPIIVLAGVSYFACSKFQKDRLISFCVGLFFICLLPVSNIIPSSVYFAERYLYPGALGFCLLMGLYIKRMIYSPSKWLSKVAMGLLIIFIVLSCGRIWIRSFDWRNDMTLFESAVRHNPYSALMRTDLGLVYSHTGQYDRAIEMFNKAILLRDDDPETYFVMANAYTKLKQHKSAVENLQKAISLNPEYAEAYYNLAGTYAFLGYAQESIESLDKAVFYYSKRGERQEGERLKGMFLQYWRSRGDSSGIEVMTGDNF